MFTSLYLYMVILIFVQQVSWRKNGGNLYLIPGLPGRISMLLTNDLVLSEVGYYDAGWYTCKAMNEYGEASNTTYVTVVIGG